MDPEEIFTDPQNWRTRTIGGRNVELPVELCALVDINDSIGGWFPMPDGIVQEALDSVQDNLKRKKYNLV